MLSEIKLKSDLFDKMIESFPWVEYVGSEFYKYKNGCRDKNIIRYNEEYLICKKSFLFQILGEEICVGQGWKPSWEQVIVRRDTENINYQRPITTDISGTYAYAYIMKMLRKHYTVDEIEDILNSHTAEYNDKLIQQHTIPGKENVGKLICWKNCFKYDINAAHTYMLVKLFPRATKDIMKMYEHRHDNDGFYKKVLNYYVGALCLPKHNHRPTYNYIVQSITDILVNFELEVGGYIVYENTDGVIIQAPDNIKPGSDKLGELKLEYTGDVYTYRDKNYWCIYSNELKGNCLNEVRQYIDLPNGKVVHYDKVRDELTRSFKAQNMTIETLNKENW